MSNAAGINPSHPSHALYQALQTAYEHFNRELFDARLPPVIFTVQRQNDVLGYFAPDRWISPEGDRCHEIAINPSHMGQSRVIEVLQTLAHEMVHCWQHCYGSPGRSCYHNKQWAKKMVAIGLQPSSTGEVGGAITGQHMSDYPLENSHFLRACESLVHNKAFRIPWIYRLSLPKGLEISIPPDLSTTEFTEKHSGDELPVISAHPEPINISSPLSLEPDTFLHSTYREVLPEGSFLSPPSVKSKRKVKYQCPNCAVNVWGKQGINLICGDCRMDLEMIS